MFKDNWFVTLCSFDYEEYADQCSMMGSILPVTWHNNCSSEFYITEVTLDWKQFYDAIF